MRPLFVIVCLLGLCACTAVPKTAQMLSPRQLADLPESVYRIQEGDTLDVRFRFTPELNDTEMVRLDGRISLIYLPDLQVSDMTVEELRKTLQSRYASLLTDPVITVSVRNSSASRVFVGGEVLTPGEFAFSGRGTLSQYLTKAGGIKPSGAGNDILLIRRGPDFKPYMCVLDADAVFSGANTAQDIALRPYDVVYVPPSTITQVDRFADQYIRQIVPITFGLNYILP